MLGLPDAGAEKMESQHDPVEKLPEFMEEEKRHKLDVSRDIALPLTLNDHGLHASYDLEESRVLQTHDGTVANQIEISCAISTVVGPGAIERHFGNWEKIELILASIPGAKTNWTSTTTTSLKVRDLRKTHTQKALNLNPSSLQRTKHPNSKFASKAAQRLLPSSLEENRTHKPKKPTIPRPSRLHNLNLSSHTPPPKRPSPSPHPPKIPLSIHPPPKPRPLRNGWP